MRSTPDTILLCGGAGLRLRSVIGNAPKGMASLSGRPFLELLLRQLRRSGFERIILAVGYQKDMIRSHFGDGAFGMCLKYSAESSPLGTGGALRNAVKLVTSEDVLIMNGDSYTDADLNQFVKSHLTSEAEASVLVVPVDGRDDCGTVSVDPNGRLIGFAEKQGGVDAHYVNAGIYILPRRILDELPPGLQISLEKELFPQWLSEGRNIRAFVWPGTCIDIGTPERYRSAQGLLGGAEMEKDLFQGQSQQ